MSLTIENLNYDQSAPLNKKKVAIYARVSTVEQAEKGYSIDEQVRVLREMCERENYEIYREYVDRGISGKNIKGRPALRQLLHDASNKQFDIVLVWKMNRLSRRSLDLLTIVDNLKSKNIAFRSYTENYETETPAGKLQFQMMAAIAEFERDNISENVKMGMIARAKTGAWNGGQVLGYDVVKEQSVNGEKKQSKLVVNEKEAIIVRKIFGLYIQGHGYKSITNRLNKSGHKSKKGNNFSINAVKTILLNPVYAGYIRFNVRRNWNEKRRNDINPNPVIEKGQHEAIITLEDWNKTQELLKSRGKRPNRVHSGRFPLTGIMRCPVCDAGMVIGRTTNRNKDGTKRVLEYYVCGAWKNKGTAVCRSNGVRTDYANKFVLDKLGILANQDVVIERVVKAINSHYQETNSPFQHEYDYIMQELASIDKKKEKLFNLVEEDIITKTDLSTRLNKLNQDKEDLVNQLQPIQEKLTIDKPVEVTDGMVKGVMQSFVKAFESALTSEQQKRLLQLLIHQITIGKDRKIETIEIQLNPEIIKYFTNEGSEGSSIHDGLSLPFLIVFDIMPWV